MNHYLNTCDDWYRMPVMTAKIGANAEERQVFFDAGMQINYFPLSQRDILAGMHEIQRTSVRFITESGQTHKIEGVMTLFTKMEEEHMIIAESQFQGSVEMKFLIGLMNNLPITIGEKSIRRMNLNIKYPLFFNEKPEVWSYTKWSIRTEQDETKTLVGKRDHNLEREWLTDNIRI